MPISLISTTSVSPSAVASSMSALRCNRSSAFGESGNSASTRRRRRARRTDRGVAVLREAVVDGGVIDGHRDDRMGRHIGHDARRGNRPSARRGGSSILVGGSQGHADSLRGLATDAEPLKYVRLATHILPKSRAPKHWPGRFGSPGTDTVESPRSYCQDCELSECPS